MIAPFKKAIPVIERIENAGFEAYFVGGAIRDYVLNRPIADVDIATSALPSELKAIFSKTVDVGVEHGTIVILYDGESYEATTFRTESSYQDYRRPTSVTFVRSLHEDLQRRDFTMNAIAMTKTGTLIDPFNGYKAIQQKLIQTVGAPEERFQEDALRMMRAIRFVSQLGFQLHEETKTALTHFAPLLQHIAVERIGMEFSKLLAGVYKKTAFELLIQTKLYQQLPDLITKEEAIKKCYQLNLAPLNEIQMWLLLLYLLELKNAQDFLWKWKLPGKKVKYLVRALLLLQERMQQNWSLTSLYYAKEETAIDVEIVYQTLSGNSVDQTANNMKASFKDMVITDRNELAVTGNDVMKWLGKSGGPWLKSMLQHIEIAVLHKQLENNKDSIKEWVQTCNLQLEKDC